MHGSSDRSARPASASEPRADAKSDRPAARAGHELNNALTSVLGWVQIARRSTDDAARRDRALEIGRAHV